MNANSASRKLLSLICIIGGIAMLVVSLIMDFSGSGVPYRGALLVCGIIALILGLYLFPTLKYHRRIIYIIFLFPLLFTFAVTVIIPLCLGIFYSFTDWTGIQYTQFVGFGNYISMFQDPQFIWSILITFIFVVINMILVNLIAFLLALLCTNGIKGDGFFRAAYFLPNLIGGIVLGYIWQFVFSNVLIKLTNNISLLSSTNGFLPFISSAALIPAMSPCAAASSYPELPLNCPAQKNPFIFLYSRFSSRFIGSMQSYSIAYAGLVM